MLNYISFMTEKVNMHIMPLFLSKFIYIIISLIKILLHPPMGISDLLCHILHSWSLASTTTEWTLHVILYFNQRLIPFLGTWHYFYIFSVYVGDA